MNSFSEKINRYLVVNMKDLLTKISVSSKELLKRLSFQYDFIYNVKKSVREITLIIAHNILGAIDVENFSVVLRIL